MFYQHRGLSPMRLWVAEIAALASLARDDRVGYNQAGRPSSGDDLAWFVPMLELSADCNLIKATEETATDDAGFFYLPF
jgi:hypothetical protein